MESIQKFAHTMCDKLCNCEINVSVSVLGEWFIDIRLSSSPSIKSSDRIGAIEKSTLA